MSALVERWHPKTASFHLPFGEMFILPEDVANLLHIPVHGKFFTMPPLTRDQEDPVLVDQLGVTRDEAEEEIRKASGPYVRFKWLYQLVQKLVKKKRNLEKN